MRSENVRRAAFLEALDWLEYRIEVCRKTEDEWAASHGEDSRGCATERAARFELELAITKIARIANMRRNSRVGKDEAQARAKFVSERRALRRLQGAPDA